MFLIDPKQIINQRQLSWLTSSIITSGGILTLQNVMLRISQMDAWYSYFFSALYVCGIAAFFGYLTKHYPEKHIFTITKEVLGRWGGTLVNLIMVFHFWQIVVRDVASISHFSSTLLLHSTPFEILIFLPCFLLMYFGKTSVEVIARVNDLFYPLFMVTILAMPLMLANEFFPRLLTPTLTTPGPQLLTSGFLTLGSAGDLFILGAFLHMLYNSNHVRSSIRHGALLGLFLLTMLLFLIIAVLGPKMPGNFLYPVYNLVQMIHITDFLDRLDLVMLMIWFPTIACKMIAIYLALLIGISSIINEPNYPYLNKPISLLMVVSTILSFKNITEVLSFSNFCSPVIVLAYQPLLVLLIFIVTLVKKRKEPDSQSSASSKAQPHGKKSAQFIGKVSQLLPYSVWRWGGDALIVLCGGCILVGLMFSRHTPLVGIVCGATFAVCFFLTTLTTYMEVTILKQAESGGS
ncbi:GerAB/ArcD/ProY family transporter [Paenibacillus whitsoniae]|uniref:GerAB/ArcD/ProY family transporter n=1 Tax=Paenibacillus whitsoniae TaxID=2496558 RepID=UPI0013DFAB05|nr:endospore germination permease [Paenibacillus whitsoniae]